MSFEIPNYLFSLPKSTSKQQWSLCKINSGKRQTSWKSYLKADDSCWKGINMMVKQKDRESVHISIPASTARRKQYGASTIFCTATSGRPSSLNHFWCNLYVRCSFLTGQCVAPPYNTLLVMTIWNFLSSLIFSTSSLNSTMNKRLDPIKCRISLNIIFFSYI